jgi:hypothetical protein
MLSNFQAIPNISLSFLQAFCYTLLSGRKCHKVIEELETVRNNSRCLFIKFLRRISSHHVCHSSSSSLFTCFGCAILGKWVNHRHFKMLKGQVAEKRPPSVNYVSQLPSLILAILVAINTSEVPPWIFSLSLISSWFYYICTYHAITVILSWFCYNLDRFYVNHISGKGERCSYLFLRNHFYSLLYH